jgi:hypothetical protein
LALVGFINLPIDEEVKRLSADNDALAASGGWNELVLGGGAAGLLIGVAAARSAAIELNTVTGASDTVALAGAGGAGRVVRHGGRLGEGGSAAGAEWWADGWRWVELIVGVLLVEGGLAEAAGDVGNSDLIKGAIFCLEDSLGGVWGDWLWRLDLGDGERATLGNIGGESAGFTAWGRRMLAWRAGVLARGRWFAGRGWLGWLAGLLRLLRLLRLFGWNVENVQYTASSGFGRGRLGRVVRDMVPIDDVLSIC